MSERPVFTLRLNSASTHERLKAVAAQIGTSMNEIAVVAIERELDFLGADLEAELLATVKALREWRYTDQDLERDLDAFAEAEASLRDPMRSTMSSSTQVDELGIEKLFANPVEYRRSG